MRENPKAHDNPQKFLLFRGFFKSVFPLFNFFPKPRSIQYVEFISPSQNFNDIKTIIPNKNFWGIFLHKKDFGGFSLTSN